MKKTTTTFSKLLFAAGIVLIAGYQPAHAQFFKKLVKDAKSAAQQGIDQTTSDHAENDASNATNNTIDKIEHPNFRRNNNNDNRNNNNDNNINNNSDNNSSGKAHSSALFSSSVVPTLKTYKNYDFVPGDSIIFADDFSDDQVGELPSHWILCSGQGQVNAFDGKKVFVCTAGDNGGSTAILEARMKKKYGYIPKAFTVEFDMFVPSGSYDAGGRGGDAGLTFYPCSPDDPGGLIDCWPDMDLDNSTLTFTTGNLHNGNLDLPDNIAGDNFNNKWHHVAMAYRDGQMKIYLDQNRIFVIPQVPDSSMEIFGIQVTKLCYVTNIRLAEGGGMTMLQKKFTADKIVTHGITFDVDKSDIKPTSMGTLNMIVRLMNKNPDLKFEIDGHTDNTGQAAHNLTLSQQRADAIKAQLVKMGIDGSRLTTKGFGDTVPIADNSTPAGRANNRRVEFVRMK